MNKPLIAKPGSVDLERDGQIARVTINRPTALNSMTMEMYEALGDICARVSDGDEPDVRVVVFRGAGGRCFSSGTDIGVLAAFQTAEDGIAYEQQMDHFLGAIAAIPVPTVAVVDRLAVGGGLNIAAACDIRIASDDARFGTPMARTLGTCLSMRNYANLLSAFGVSRAKRMLMLAETIDAHEALACAFLTRIAPAEELDAVADEIVGTLLASSPITQRVSKAAIARLGRAGHPDGDDLVAAAYGSEDFRGAVEAFFAKRKPVWNGK